MIPFYNHKSKPNPTDNPTNHDDPIDHDDIAHILLHHTSPVAIDSHRLFTALPSKPKILPPLLQQNQSTTTTTTTTTTHPQSTAPILPPHLFMPTTSEQFSQSASANPPSQPLNSSPNVQPSQLKHLLKFANQKSVSFTTSEFVAFAIHKIWHRPNPTTKNTTNTTTKHANPPFCNVVCPPGTNSWYPAFFEIVHKVLAHSKVTLPLVLIALLYIVRLRKVVPESISGIGTEYRVFISAIVLAQKFHSDFTYSTKSWSKIALIPACDIKRLEREFLKKINYSLHVTDLEYFKWELAIKNLGNDHASALLLSNLNLQRTLDLCNNPSSDSLGKHPSSGLLRDNPSLHSLPDSIIPCTTIVKSDTPHDQKSSKPLVKKEVDPPPAAILHHQSAAQKLVSFKSAPYSQPELNNHFEALSLGHHFSDAQPCFNNVHLDKSLFPEMRQYTHQYPYSRSNAKHSQALEKRPLDTPLLPDKKPCLVHIPTFQHPLCISNSYPDPSHDQDELEPVDHAFLDKLYPPFKSDHIQTLDSSSPDPELTIEAQR